MQARRHALPRVAAVIALAAVSMVSCTRRDGEGPEVRLGAVPPPVSPPEGASPRLEPPPSPRDEIDRERAADRASAVANLVINRAALAQARASGVEAVSLLGDSLRRPAMTAAARSTQEQLLAQARLRWERDSAPDDLIWMGRRLGYLGRYNEAVEVFTTGMRLFPGDARFLRHRGHRWLTLRHFERAEEDLALAASMVDGRPDETEPDGMPNERGIPTSTLQSNIHYHLGLARYLQADWQGALEAWNDALEVSRNPDMRVATDYWRYLTLRRLSRDDEARDAIAWVTPRVDIIENQAYFRLLLFYSGQLELSELEPANPAELNDVSVGYGLGVWELLEGRSDAARARFERLMAGGNWPAFGYIAAEAEMARMGQG